MLEYVRWGPMCTPPWVCDGLCYRSVYSEIGSNMHPLPDFMNQQITSVPTEHAPAGQTLREVTLVHSAGETFTEVV